jgi:hypothetical protein
MHGCPLSARQRYVLGWLDRHDTHYAGWNDAGTSITIKGKDCCIQVKAQDWHALRGLIASDPPNRKIFCPNGAGRAVLAAE